MPKNDYYLPSRTLVSQQDSAIIPRADVPRSKFHNRWDHLAPINAGKIYPILIDEVLPGDHMRYSMTAFVRMATALFPIFSNQRIDTHWFFCPNRLVWTNWVRMMGEQDTPTDSIAFTVPTLQSPANGYDIGSLQDHMGLGTVGQIAAAEVQIHNVLPLRMYNLIWNLWFRDQNIMSPAPMHTGDAGDLLASYVIRDRAKSHDYFTSALPWPQKFVAPLVPLGGLAPITGIAGTTLGESSGAGAGYETGNVAVNYAGYKQAWDPAAANQILIKTIAPGVPDVYADLSQATGVAINTFRQAIMIQSLLERDARGGTRYTELLKAHFGVTNQDYRLQRPEYIGGGQTPLHITPIAQTAPTDDAPLGALGATGTAVGSHSASYAATEHGFIIALLSIKTELSYQQGTHRQWYRSTRYDYYWPSLAQLGEQTVLRRELYVRGDVNDTIVFGYQERHHEYRTRYSDVVGIFRSTAAGTIDQWHLAGRFTSAPTLSATFLNDTPPLDRVLAAGELAQGQQYLCNIEYRRTATRPIPTFGVPANLGRF